MAFFIIGFSEHILVILLATVITYLFLLPIPLKRSSPWYYFGFAIVASVLVMVLVALFPFLIFRIGGTL